MGSPIPPCESQLDSAALGLALVRKIRTVLSTAEEELLFADIAAVTQPLIISFLNEHGMNLAWKLPRFGASLLGSDILLRDGVGVEICMKALGRDPGRNMNGTDLIPRIAASFAGKPTAVFGTTEPWLSKAGMALSGLGCDVVSVLDGFQASSIYMAAAMQTRPALIILAMGHPKQEVVAKDLAAALNYPVIIINGGAIADFLAGRFRRAPALVRHARMEWMFRLIQEPRRLWRRYVLGGALFAYHVLALRVGFSGR